LIADLYWRTAVLPLRNERAERRSANEQQKKLARFEELAAALAHEIRNPLTTISALNHTIQRKLSEGTAEHRDAVGIRREIDHINEILKDFIHLARPSAPNLTLMTAESLLKEVRDLMQPQLQADAIRLDCELKGQALFYGDRQQLKQVLTNLIRNAAESIHHGGDIQIRTSDATIPFKGKMAKVARIEVEDNGPGIRPEVQARLFEPFFSTKKEGTGLGLPISARIVDSHGGKLDFETQPGRATIFRVVLPAHEERE
jgi:signal transduction histidine kinase